MPELSIHKGVGRLETGTATPASTTGVTVTSGTGTAKGDYAELAVPTLEWAGFWLYLWRDDSMSQIYLADLAVGSMGSEQIRLADFWVGVRDNLVKMYVPLRVRVGQRVALRCASGTTGQTFQAMVQGVPAGPNQTPSYHRGTVYGVASRTDFGVLLDPGGVAHTDSGWGQITASLTRPCKAVTVCTPANSDAATLARWLVDLGRGAAGAEQTLITDIPVRKLQFTRNDYVYGLVHLNLPAGIRLAARARCSVTDATARTIRVHLIGWE